MKKPIVAIVSGAAGLGLALAVAATGVASAAPGGVGRLVQRVELVHTTIPTDAHTSVTASCRPNEILTGGGYTVYSVGPYDKVFSSAPIDDKTWAVQILNQIGSDLQVDVMAVCVSRV